MEGVKRIHFVKNFPKTYSFFERVYAEIIVLFVNLTNKKMKSFLTSEDKLNIRKILVKGDIVLIRNFRNPSNFIHGIFSHSALYAGKQKFIHTTFDGVKESDLDFLFKNYDCFVVLRTTGKPEKNKKIIDDAIAYAKNQVGKPYDFEFKGNFKGNEFFCTSLINDSYKQAGYDTGLFNVSKGFKKFIKRILNYDYSILHPKDFLKGNFKKIYVSSNLNVIKNKIYFGKN